MCAATHVKLASMQFAKLQAANDRHKLYVIALASSLGIAGHGSGRSERTTFSLFVI